MSIKLFNISSSSTGREEERIGHERRHGDIQEVIVLKQGITFCQGPVVGPVH